MMDVNKVDRLFQEKLHGYEVKPEEDSWLEVKKQLAPKRYRAVSYWVAATVSFLILSFSLFWSGLDVVEEHQQMAINIDHPDKQEIFNWMIRKTEKSGVSESKPGLRAGKESGMATILSPEKEKQAQIEILEVAKKRAFAKQANLAELKPLAFGNKDLRPIDEKESQIRITYIASEEQNLQKTTQPNTFKRLLTFAGKIS
ncbi:MAG: hypothetical protein AAF551_08030, partial [Bacteroidota bacterium]